MWRGINKYYFWLLWTLTFLAGTALYCMIFSPDIRRYLFRLFSDNLSSFSSVFQWCATILLILILVILWVEFRRMKTHESSYEFSASEGKAAIAQSTLNRFIKSVVRTFMSVRSVTVRSAIEGDRLGVIARIRVNDTVPLKTLIDDIQHTVRIRIRETFGQDIVSDLRIEVTDIHASPHSPADSRTEPEQPGFISVPPEHDEEQQE
jgi:hypothetical protein